MKRSTSRGFSIPFTTTRNSFSSACSSATCGSASAVTSGTTSEVSRDSVAASRGVLRCFLVSRASCFFALRLHSSPTARSLGFPGGGATMSAEKKQDALDLSDLNASLPGVAAGLSGEDRAKLVDVIKDKLKQSAVLEDLSPNVRKRVEVLREIQSQHDEFEAKFFEERAALEAKYQKFYEPLYTKRCEIVNGVVEVEGVTIEATDGNSAEEKGVPHFWLNALKTNEVLADEIQERDEGALKFLKDIKWCRIDNPKGFKLEFYFDTNPYFENSVLTKTYHMIDEDDPILEKAIGTKIVWYPGKCLTQKTMVKKPKKGSKNTKPITKTEQCESFFNFFSPPEVPDDDADIDEEEAEELQNQMEQDYDIGATIRDKIIPHAVSWFTGEAAQDDDLVDFEGGDNLEDIDEEDEDEDDDDEDDDEEEEDGEDDDDEEGTKPKKGTTKKKSGGGQQADRPAECKQQ